MDGAVAAAEKSKKKKRKEIFSESDGRKNRLMCGQKRKKAWSRGNEGRMENESIPTAKRVKKNVLYPRWGETAEARGHEGWRTLV